MTGADTFLGIRPGARGPIALSKILREHCRGCKPDARILKILVSAVHGISFLGFIILLAPWQTTTPTAKLFYLGIATIPCAAVSSGPVRL
jgi:hypothetical protein